MILKTFKTLKLSKNKKYCWIFGAGASASAPYHVPVQSDILKVFFTKGKPGNPSAKSLISVLQKRITSYANKVFPGVNPVNDYFDLEELFSYFEIVRDSQMSDIKERNGAIEAIKELKESIRLATRLYGRADAQKWKPHASRKTNSPYADLLKHLFPNPNSNNAKTHRFITFNYDICLDRCLINLKSDVQLHLDYGMQFSNERAKKAPDFHSPSLENSVLLLRTHGGVNWIRCDECQSLFTTIDKHAQIKRTSRCWSCKSKLIDYVLVHPSFTRTYDDPLIKLIWGRCYEELVNSNCWVFIGYSLPNADVHFRHLLRHCLARRQSKNKKTNIYVISKKTKDSSYINSVVESNYYKLFQNDALVWESTIGVKHSDHNSA